MIDIFSKFNLRTFTDRDPGKWYSHPGRDWKIIFFTTAVVSLCLVIAHSSLYDYVSTHDILFFDASPQKEQDGGINEKGLRNVMIEFSARKTRTDMLLNATGTMTDPSKFVSSALPLEKKPIPSIIGTDKKAAPLP